MHLVIFIYIQIYHSFQEDCVNSLTVYSSGFFQRQFHFESKLSLFLQKIYQFWVLQVNMFLSMLGLVMISITLENLLKQYKFISIYWHMKLSRREKQINKQRENSFNNNWNVNEVKRNYDALDDIYATYYFNNPAVRKHLKHISRVVKKEPPTSQILRIKKLFDGKVKRFSEEKNKYIQYESEYISENSRVKSYQKRGNPKSVHRLQKLSKYDPEESQKDILRAESLNEGLPLVKKNRIYLSKEQKTDMDEARRKKKFLDYLLKRKEEIEKQKIKV